MSRHQTPEEAVEELAREYREVHGYTEEDARLAAEAEVAEGMKVTDDDLATLMAEVLEWEGEEPRDTPRLS